MGKPVWNPLVNPYGFSNTIAGARDWLLEGVAFARIRLEACFLIGQGNPTSLSYYEPVFVHTESFGGCRNELRAIDMGVVIFNVLI